eukprot:scaffold485_cov272-Pinguiococcus_pyrenoidosus.AAC.9
MPRRSPGPNKPRSSGPGISRESAGTRELRNPGTPEPPVWKAGCPIVASVFELRVRRREVRSQAQMMKRGDPMAVCNKASSCGRRSARSRSRGRYTRTQNFSH